MAEETQTAIGGISISDVDAAAANVTARLQVTNGVLDVVLSGGTTISAGGNGSDDLTIQGTLVDVNATLASLQYTGNSNVNGIAADTLTVTTGDGGNTGSGGAQQDVDTVQIDITAVNDAPVAAGGYSFTVGGNDTLSVSAPGLLANASDADGDTLSAVLVSGPSSGVLNLNADGSFSYVPGNGFSGSVAFSYVVSDGTTTSDVVTVTIEVTPVIGPPITNTPTTNADSESTSEDEDDSAEALEVVPSAVPQSTSAPASNQANEVTSRPPVHVTVQLIADANAAQDAFGSAREYASFERVGDQLPRDIRQAIEAVSQSAPQLTALVDTQLLYEKLNDFRDGVTNDDQVLKWTAGSVAITSLAFTAGYVLWTIKGGYLLAGVLSQMPAWRWVDPLPIFDAVNLETLHNLDSAEEDDDIWKDV